MADTLRKRNALLTKLSMFQQNSLFYVGITKLKMKCIKNIENKQCERQYVKTIIFAKNNIIEISTKSTPQKNVHLELNSK